MMETRFNLIDKPWIPCVLNDGSYFELGIRDILALAPRIREIADPSPLVTVSLHRLLLAILHRNFGPATDAAWGALWSAGAFDVEMLDAYFAAWRSRFDLFDSERPFYQTVAVDFEYRKSTALMVHGLTLGNFSTLFDHTLDASPPELTPAEAARQVVTHQTFALGGLIGFQSKHGESASPHKFTTQALLAKGAVALVRGDTLFETLMLNLMRYDVGHPIAINDPSTDRPAWEHDHPAQSRDKRPLGYLDVLTWQPRRIRFYPELGAGGEIVVRSVVLMRGYQLDDSVLQRDVETMVAFRELAKPQKGQDPYIPISLQPDRALWRDSTALFQSVDGRGLLRPRNLEYASNLAGRGALDEDAIYAVDILGMSFYQVMIYFWRHERLPLPVRLLRDVTLADRIGQAVSVAESTARLFVSGIGEIPVEGKSRKMPRPLQIFAESMLSAPGSNLKADPARVRGLVESLAPEQIYWSRLETEFKRFVEVLGAAEELEARTLWRDAVRRAAYDAFDGMLQSFDTDARALRASVTAERAFRTQLALILNDFLPQPQATEDRVASSA